MSTTRPAPDTDDAYAVFSSSPLLARVHGREFLNVGWREAGGPGPAGDPAAVLVDRLLAWASPGATVAIDVACGRGGAAERIRRHCPHAQIVGLDRSPAMLAGRNRTGPAMLAGRNRTGPAMLARRNPAETAFLRADAVALPLRTESADLVLCVEAALHFPSRHAFFREAARVLRPGGRLVLTDLLVDPAEPAWAAIVPAANRQTTAAQYAQTLIESGLQLLHLADITDQTWDPYVAALIAAAAEISPAAAERMRDTLRHRPVHGYLEAVAVRR